MKIKNKVIYIIGFIFLFSPIFTFAQTEKDEAVRFAVFGHVYPNYEALEASVEKVNELNPDFVVFLGDTLPPHHQTEWNDVLNITDKINAEKYFVPGNHDIEDRAEDKKYFIENIGPLYQSFTKNGVEFVLLNTASIGAPIASYDVDQQQIDWLEKVYKNNTQKIILAHHCLFYQDNSNICNNRGRLISAQNNWNKFVVPLIKANTLAVFLGDVGSSEPYFSYKENELQYYGVGFGIDSLKYPPHFLEVTLYKNGKMNVRPVIINDNLENVNSLKKAEHRPSFKENLPKFSYERLRMITIVYLKKIAALFFASTVLFFAISIYLFYKFKKRKL